MSTEPEKKLFAPLADAYGPTDADADRVFAKIQASLAALPGGSSAPAAPSAPPTPKAPPVAGALTGKKVALAGLCALVLAGGVMAWSRGPAPAAPVATAAAVEAPVVAPPIVAPSLAPTTAALPSIAVDSLPSAELPRPLAVAKPAALQAAPAPETPSSETLEKEARLLAEARRAVQRGDAARGLALLDEHARTFPNGWLAADRAAERIVVLCSLGRRDEAAAESRVFLAGRPDGPLTRRVTTSCAGQ